MKVSYDSWLSAVRRHLVHPDAINHVIGGDTTLRMAHQIGVSPSKVARKMSERWRLWRSQEVEEKP